VPSAPWGASVRPLNFTVKQHAMKRTSLLLSAVAMFTAAGQVGLAGTEAGHSLLNELRRELASVRSVPIGTKVSLRDKKLGPLLGLSSADIQRFLGWPSYCGHDAGASS
jgi:hypothetical protein